MWIIDNDLINDCTEDLIFSREGVHSNDYDEKRFMETDRVQWRVKDDVLREMDDVLEAMNRLDIHLRELRFERFKEEMQCQK